MGQGVTQQLRQAFSRVRFYWQRLRGERVTKSLGIGVAVFALVMQSFAVIQPQSAQAAVSDPNDNIIYQGAANKAQLLAIYDSGRDSAGHTDIKQIYTAMGITRDDLVNASEGTYYTDDFNGQIKTLGRMDWKQANRSQLNIPGATTPIYTGGFLDGYNAIHYPMTPALIGKRAVDGQWFAITLDCGNIVYVTPPPVPVKNISVCRPGTGVITIKETDRLSTDLAPNDAACQPKPIVYITVCRPGTGVITIKETDKLSTDVAPDSELCKPKPVVKNIMVCRPGTGVITIKETDKLSTDLAPEDEACKPKPIVPAVSRITVCRPGTGVITINETDRRSTDLAANDAACQPTPVVQELPKTGAGETVLGAFGLGLLAAATYFYWDSRRLLGVGRF